MGYMYLLSMFTLVWISNVAYAGALGRPRNLCNRAEDEIVKQCGSHKLREMWSSQGFTAIIDVETMSDMLFTLIRTKYIQDDAFSKRAGYHFPKNISSYSSKHIDCVLYDRYTQCTEEFGISGKCFSKEDFITRASFGYICGVGRDDYLQSAICLKQMDVFSAVALENQCDNYENMEKYIDALYEVIASNMATNEEQLLDGYLQSLENVLCSIRKDLYSCTEPWVRWHCGKKAESFVHGMAEHVIKSLTGIYRSVWYTFEIPSICDEQAALNLPKERFSETYIDQSINDIHNAIDVMKPILGKCSSSEATSNFIICGLQVIQESHTSMSMANSGSLHGWHAQRCSGMKRWQSCVEPRLETCPAGAIAGIHYLIDAICTYISDTDLMPGCYLPHDHNTGSACGLTFGELLDWLHIIGRCFSTQISLIRSLSSAQPQQTQWDSINQNMCNVTTLLMQKYERVKCVAKNWKNVGMSNLPKECGLQNKLDLQQIFDILDKTLEDIPKWINTTAEEIQNISHFLNHLKNPTKEWLLHLSGHHISYPV